MQTCANSGLPLNHSQMKRFVLLLVLALANASFAQAQNDSSNEALPALVQVLGQSNDTQFQLDVLKGMSDGLKGRRGVKMPAGWEEVAAKLSKSSNAQVRELVQSLSLTFGSASALASLRQTLVNSQASLQARTNALDALLQSKDPALAPVLRDLLKEPKLRASALRGLATYDDPQTPAAILGAYDALNPTEKKDALTTLVSRQSFAKPLLAAVAEKRVPAKDLSADLVRQLRNLKDTQINQQVEKVWGVSRETAADKLKEIAEFKSLIQKKGYGDPRKGRGVFSRTCQQCHTLFDAGGKVGPDITGSNRPDLDYILQNIIDPNAVIPNDYRTSTLETKDDRVITGIVTRQDDNAVTIVIPNDTLTIPRTDIQSLTQGEISMMPEGLLQSLSPDDVRDLLAYLKSPQQVPMPPEPSK
jgi:putative heme-binding domain-containing protein